MDIDFYLASPNALRQTESAEGHLLHPGQILNGFQIIAFLGRGTASEVWRVRDLHQNRDYALKIFVPPPDAPAQARQRFLTEARTLDDFRHPNLMRRYRLQESGAHPYYTMNVMSPLPEKLSRQHILALLEDVLAGLSVLHEKGIVHRDIKPANILLNDFGHAVLADLGVVHIEDPILAKRLYDTAIPKPTLVCGSPFVGTPHYAAPEQLVGEAVSPATDIYALGIVIDELLGGNPPFLWKMLIRRMTAARQTLRLQNIRQVHKYLRFIRLTPWIRLHLLLFAIAVSATLLWRTAQPVWIEVSENVADVITLDGGHYFQQRLHVQPLAEPGDTSTITATNGVDCQFEKMFATRYRRRPIFIQGRGTFKCPDVVGCEIHLAAGVTFITSGRFTPDGTLIKSPMPPADADETHHIGYPAYVVENGAMLIFTENAAYPPALIRRK